jgi:hypothetical protein
MDNGKAWSHLWIYHAFIHKYFRSMAWALISQDITGPNTEVGCWEPPAVWAHDCLVGAIDWMCSPKIQILSSILQCDDIWRWGLWEVIGLRWGHEGGTLSDGICALIRRNTENSLSPHHVRTQREGSHSKPGRETSPGTELAGTLIFDFQDFSTLRNTCLFVMVTETG